MLETSARLLRLLSLVQAQRYWSGVDLSHRLKVTGRTLRRDVDRLRSLGYPVHSTSGVAGGYQLGAGATLPPLLLDDDEAVAVALGLRTSATGRRLRHRRGLGPGFAEIGAGAATPLARPRGGAAWLRVASRDSRSNCG